MLPRHLQVQICRLIIAILRGGFCYSGKNSTIEIGLPSICQECRQTLFYDDLEGEGIQIPVIL